MTQEQALELIKKGHNVFITGKAGTGKTFLLNLLKTEIKDKLIFYTASTGIASTHLDGMTIHSYSGIGVKGKSEMTDHELVKLQQNMYFERRMNATDILVIDEISMLHAYQLDMIDRVCRFVRNGNEAFGGLQVIFCGDFFQLPPVVNGDDKVEFAFESVIWNNMGLKICYLEHVYRQSDLKFLQILNEIRANDIQQDSIDFLTSRMNKNVEMNLTPIKLYPTNREVDTINDDELYKINAPIKSYHMKEHGKQKWMIDNLKKSCLAPETLYLKEGASVMFIKNKFNYSIEDGMIVSEPIYTNGTMCTVVGFNDFDIPIVELANGNKVFVEPVRWEKEDLSFTGEKVVVAYIEQIPLKLAWAITVHKSQGMSLDCAEMDLSRTFTEGMGYVALSRVKSLDGIKLTGINEMVYKVNYKISEIDKIFKEQSEQCLSNLE